MNTKIEKIYPNYLSNQKSKSEKQVVLLMIQNGNIGSYLTVKKNISFIIKIVSKHFYCLNCLHSFRAKDKLESPKKLCENKDFFNIVMISKETKTLKFNWYQISDKAPFIIYADFECLIEKIDGCKNNSENLSATKTGEHIAPGPSFSTILSFKIIENKHNVYRGKDWVQTFCKPFREHAIEIII